ncbi:MAG: adenylate cyclase [Proteobacteria bacterium]|nr:adenylate cyclase [Pseudomonadota bacterium]
MAVAALRLLGTFELTLGDGRPVDLPGQKDRALLAVLALSGSAPQSREKLASLLWGDHGEAQARDSLKHALTRIRQCLGDTAQAALFADRQSVRLDPGGLSSDVTDFEHLARQQSQDALERACALYAGELLEDINLRSTEFEAWLLVERQRLRRLHEEALSALLRPSVPIGMRESAAWRLVKLDPLREAASRALMQIHVDRGETAQAIRLFEALRDRLHAEMGVKPERETTALYEALRWQHTEPAVSAAAPVTAQAAAPVEPPLPAKPSIAVLPFQNLSGDPEQEYFADGMVEEIITALSRMRWLFVIARNSSFTYRSRAVDVKQISRELGVRYVLEGSVRKAANRVRITGQLIDATTGAHLWADRFDGGLDEVFDLQDQVATSVVCAIAPKLERAEIERTKRKATGSLDAYDHFLRGMASVHHWTQEASDEALQHFRRAIELDPDYISAYGMVARCYSQRKVSGWVKDREEEIADSVRLAKHVAQFGTDDPLALVTAGMALGYVVGELEDGDAMIERGLILDPNLTWGWLFSGWTKVWLGDWEAALERMQRAMRLSPQDPQFFNMQTGAAWAYLLAGRYAEAQSWAQAALRARPDYLNPLCIMAACAALAGNLEDARKNLAHMQQIDPGARISNIQQRYPFRRQEDLARFGEGLRLAGLPE